MKSLILTLSILLLTGLSNTTAQNKVDKENEKIVTHMVGNHYDVIMFSSTGEVLQEGHYYKEGDRYLEHGVWKLYDYNTYELVTRAKYDKGVQIWVETWIDGEMIRVTQKDREVSSLKARVAELEKQLAEIDY
ncbi:MAG: hypothetical protein ACPGGA_01500 [Balneolaceae bacterium]